MERLNYEYIRLAVDMGDLSTLNRLGSEGWRVVAMTVDGIVLLERPLPAKMPEPAKPA